MNNASPIQFLQDDELDQVVGGCSHDTKKHEKHHHHHHHQHPTPPPVVHHHHHHKHKHPTRGSDYK